MKITKNTIKQFEREQKSFGTDVALYNVIWQIAADILAGIGVKHISTSDKPRKR
jgi:hypothetical protein